MKTPSISLVALFVLSLHAGWAADAEKKDRDTPPAATAAKPVRLRFVPKAHEGNGASSTELHAFPGPDSRREAVQAWAGVGDSFPVREKGGKTLFEVAVVAGDDDRLEIEIRLQGAPQKVTVVRDQRATVKVAGKEYEFVYPSVRGSSADKTDQAMIIVSRAR
jgi:hypothetical protein